MVMNALSCQYEHVGSLLALPLPIPKWLDVAHQEWFNDPSTDQLIHTLKTTLHNPLGQLVLTPTSTLKQMILQELHSSATMVHSSF